MAKTTPKRRKKSTAKRRPQQKSKPVVKASKAKKPRGLRARNTSARAADRRRVLDAKNRARAARETRKALKHKTAKPTRRIAKAIGKAFKGGKTKQIGFRPSKGPILTAPTTTAEKEKRLARIGIKPYKSKRKRTPAQRRKLEQLYGDFAEFASRGAFKSMRKFRIIRTTNKATLDKARKSGMAVYENSIYVHISRTTETARLGSFMGEKIIARTYYGKLERIFLGGADTFSRVVKKLQVKQLAPGQMITGAFFGGPTFHRAIYSNVGEFLNYLNNAFVPHLKAGQKPTKRNIARAKAALIKNIAIVQIENPEFEDDDE